MADFRLEIAKQLNFIISSCRLFDEGRLEEALRIAVATRVLFHNTGHSKAIVGGHLDGLNLKLLSTTMYLPGDKKSHPLGFIGMLPSMGTFKAYLDDGQRQEEIPWKDWWEKERILELMPSKETVTRKQVSLACANKDGGAHVDSERPKEYERLEDGIGLDVEAIFAGGVKRRVKLRYANLVIMRQIGHEILRSPCLTALAKLSFSTGRNPLS